MEAQRRFLTVKKWAKKHVAPSRPLRIMPKGSAAEVGKELRNMIRIIDVHIIGATKNWDSMLKKYLIFARQTVGLTPREEAESLVELIACVGLHIVQKDRWPWAMFSKELIPAVNAARDVLGMEVDDRFEGVVGKL